MNLFEEILNYITKGVEHSLKAIIIVMVIVMVVRGILCLIP